jgi:hypothetical protein
MDSPHNERVCNVITYSLSTTALADPGAYVVKAFATLAEATRWDIRLLG